MRLAVIPARGGSKRVPRKNIREFLRRPMIAWPLSAARVSGCFDRIVVSTDDEEIAAIAAEWGAEIPFQRPAELSTDHAGTVAVVAHACEWARAAGWQPVEVCCLYATAPFVRPADLLQGLEVLRKEGCDYVFPVARFGYPIQRALRIRGDRHIEMLYPEHACTRSQDLEPAYHDAGQFYWGLADTWISQRPIMSASVVPLVIPGHHVQDIDTEEDWVRAELLFEILQGKAI